MRYLVFVLILATGMGCSLSVVDRGVDKLVDAAVIYCENTGPGFRQDFRAQFNESASEHGISAAIRCPGDPESVGPDWLR